MFLFLKQKSFIGRWNSHTMWAKLWWILRGDLPSNYCNGGVNITCQMCRPKPFGKQHAGHGGVWICMVPPTFPLEQLSTMSEVVESWTLNAHHVMLLLKGKTDTPMMIVWWRTFNVKVGFHWKGQTRTNTEETCAPYKKSSVHSNVEKQFFITLCIKKDLSMTLLTSVLKSTSTVSVL